MYTLNSYSIPQQRRFSRFSPTDRLVKRFEPLMDRDHVGEASLRRRMHMLSMCLLLLLSGAFFAVTYWLFPGWYPIEAGRYLVGVDNWSDVLSSSWPMFAYGGGITLLFSLLSKNEDGFNRVAGEVTLHNLAVSVQAGFFEEINFRWIRFYISMPLLAASNWLFFGWGDMQGWVRIANEAVWLPLADWATFHKLTDYLTVVDGKWVVAVAILTANSHFRNGHKVKDSEELRRKSTSERLFLAFFPLVNSWYLGMYFFYLMFAYGLLAAIVVHAVYDMIIFIVRYIDAKLES